MSEAITKSLDDLANLQALRDKLQIEVQTMKDSVLTKEIREKLADIDAEFAPALEAVNESITKLSDDIKDMVMAHGDTVKGQYVQAVFSGGRTTWDSKKLMRYAKDHPEIMQFQKIGEPSVSFRVVKQ